MRSFFYFVLIVLSSPLFAASAAHTYSESDLSCYQSFAASRYSEAAKACAVSAAAGDSQAQYLLATMHVYGAGVQSNLETAFKLLSDAANKGHVKAAYNLAAAFDRGDAVKQDYAAALKWYGVAANAGMPEAQLGLAALYEQGKGAQADLAQAFDWYNKAASQGYSEAQLKVGLMYQQGKGVAQDREKAEQWLKLAAQSGEANAQLAYGLLIAPKDVDAAMFWLEQAGHRGLGVAYFQLAQMLSQSTKSAGIKRAIAYAERAVFEGQANALALRDELFARLQNMDQSQSGNSADIQVAKTKQKTTPAPVLNSGNSSAALKGGDWLLSQPKDAHTIQLVHNPKLSVIENYIRDNNLDSNAAYYATKREAGVTYVLVYGVFDSARLANKAVATLPTAIRQAKPWVRKFKQLQSKYRDPGL